MRSWRRSSTGRAEALNPTRLNEARSAHQLRASAQRRLQRANRVWAEARDDEGLRNIGARRADEIELALLVHGQVLKLPTKRGTVSSSRSRVQAEASTHERAPRSPGFAPSASIAATHSAW
jgi:hypothetical protein